MTHNSHNVHDQTTERRSLDFREARWVDSATNWENLHPFYLCMECLFKIRLIPFKRNIVLATKIHVDLFCIVVRSFPGQEQETDKPVHVSCRSHCWSLWSDTYQLLETGTKTRSLSVCAKGCVHTVHCRLDTTHSLFFTFESQRKNFLQKKERTLFVFTPFNDLRLFLLSLFFFCLPSFDQLRNAGMGKAIPHNLNVAVHNANLVGPWLTTFKLCGLCGLLLLHSHFIYTFPILSWIVSVCVCARIVCSTGVKQKA